VDGLVDAEALALAVREAGERGRGEETEGAGDDRGLVGEDVTEKVVGCTGY
jgi:hypothetical protein